MIRRHVESTVSGLALAPVLLALGSGASMGCRSESPPQAPDTQRVKIFLIGVGDEGRRGSLLSCGDSAVPVTVMLPAEETPLDGALRSLVELPRSVMAETGLANTLVHSQLTLKSARVKEGRAEVRLEGTLRSVPSPCQRDRVRAQLELTVLQFPEIREVGIFIDDEPLDALLGRTPRSGVSAFDRPGPSDPPSTGSRESLGDPAGLAEPSDGATEPPIER